jgi:hypothetical protein
MVSPFSSDPPQRHYRAGGAPRGEGPDRRRSRSGRRPRANESHGVADPDPARTDHLRVESELASETAGDVAEHLGVPLEGVGIDRGHRTARSKRVQADDGISDVELGARPGRLGQALDARYDDVRTQAADVTPERGDRSVGGDEEGKDVEPVEIIVGTAMGVGVGRGPAATPSFSSSLFLR